MANKKITYGIDFNVDNSNLQKVRNELNEISKLGKYAIKVDVEGSNLDTLKQSAKELQNAFENAFNPRLNTINIEKFNQSLKNLDIKRIEADFSQLGTKGAAAFRNMTSEILTTQREVRKTSNFIDSMATTLGNTIKWSIASSAINTVTGKIQEAWGYTKKLDQSLNDIRIVTEKSADSMEKFAKSANKAAKNLGTATTNYTKAALIYYQQGLGEQDVQARTQVTVKAANVTGQSASEVSEQLTAVWNGYKVVAEEAELYVDKLAAVAASTAADLEELSTGMSKVASAASTMGVDIDQLSAQLSTIVSVTRQDASLVGTALKTIYARMGDLKVDGVDEFGTSLGDVSGQLKQMGIDVLDQQGNLRDMGNVIEEVAAKWGTWTDAQQQAAAVAIAGKRQYNNLIALFENWDMYESALSTSQNSAGTLQKQQEIYMDSLEARLQRLSTAGEKVFDELIDSESTKELIDSITWIVDKLGNFVSAMGGAGNMLLTFGGIATTLFQKQIAGGISRSIDNIGIFKNNIKASRAELELMAKYEGASDEAIKEMIALKEHELHNEKLLTAEQKAQYDYYLKMTAEIYNQIDAQKQANQNAADYFNTIFQGSQYIQGTKDAGTVLETEQAISKEDAVKALKEAKETNDDIMLWLKDTKSVERAQISYQKHLEKPNDKRRNHEKAVENFEKERTKTKDLLTDAISTAGLSEKSIERLNALLEESKEKNANLLKIRSQAVQIIQQENVVMEGHIKTLEEGTEAVENLEQKHKDLKTSITDFMKGIDFTALMTGITNAVGGMMTAIGAAKALVNAFKALGDESLSTAEKIEQVLMGIGTFIASAVPSVLSSVNAIVTANKVGGSAAQKAWGWIGLILTAITTVMMIVIELVKLIPEQKSALEKAQETAKKLRDQVNELKESLKETREEYLNLIDAISNYDSAQAAIDKLRAGTDEWKEAILRANLEAQQLAETYEGLELVKEDNKYGVDIFSIDPESWDIALKNLQDKESSLQSAFNFALYRSKEADMDEDEKTVKEKIGVTYRDEFTINDLGGSTVFSKLFKDYIAPAEQAELFAKDFQVYQSYLENSEKSDGNIDPDQQLASDIYNGLTTSDSSTSKFIDDLINVSEETLDLFKQNLEENAENISEEQYRTAQKVIETIEAHKKSVDENNAALEQLYVEILKNVAKKEGIDEFVFSTLGYSKDELETIQLGKDKNKIFTDDDNREEYFGRVGKNQFVLPKVDPSTGKYLWEEDENGQPMVGTVQIETIENGIGSEINTDGDIKAAKNFIDEMVEMAYGSNAKVDSYGELDGVKIEDFGSHKIVVNGETITIGQLRNMVTSSIQAQFLEEKNQALIDRQKALANSGQLEETAFFDEEYYDPEKVAKWEGATLGKYDNIIGKSSGTTRANAEKERLEFEAEIKEYLNKGNIETSNLTAFSSLTGSQIKDIANASQAANVFGAGNAVANIIESITDPSQMQKMAALLKDIDWTDSEAVSELQRQMFELGIDIEDEEWENFFNKVNSGTKEWITNSAKVAEKLDYIKNTISNIKMGDIISDEDYKKIISLDPTKARDFIKTASGWQAIRSGKEISAGMTDRYNDLTGIRKGYSQIQSAASSLGAAGVAAGDISQLKTNSQISSFLRSNSANLNAMASAMGIPIPYGSFKDAADKLDSVPEEEKSGIKLAIQNTLNQIDQALIDNAEGLFNEDKAEEMWATSIATSREEVQKAKDEGRISQATYNKSMQSYKNTYLTELGFTEDIFNNLGAAELEEHLKNIRKLELDYFQDINKELDKIGKKIEFAFGKEKIGLIEDNINLLKEKQRLENERYNLSQSSWKEMAESALSNLYNNYGISSFEITTSGQIDNQKVLNLLAESNDENLKTNLNFLLDIWNKIEESANSAQEAMYEVLDLQIEAFRLERDMQKEFIDFSLEQMKRLSEAWSGKNISDIFGEKTFAKQMQSISNDISKTTKSFEYSFLNLADVANFAEDKIDKTEWDTAYENYQKGIGLNSVYQKQKDFYGYTFMNSGSWVDQLNAGASVEDIIFNWWEGSSWINMAESAQKKNRNIIDEALEWAFGSSYSKDTLDNLAISLGASKEEVSAAITKAVERAYGSSAYNSDALWAFARETFSGDNEFFKGATTALKKYDLVNKGGYVKSMADSWAESNKGQGLSENTSLGRMLLGSFDKTNWAMVSDVYDMLGWMGWTEGSDEDRLKDAANALGVGQNDLYVFIETYIKKAHGELDEAINLLKNPYENLEASNPYAVEGPDGLAFDTASFVEDYKEAFDEVYAQLDAMKAQVTEYYELYSTGQAEIMALYDEEIAKLSSLNSNYSNLLNLRKLINAETRDNSSIILTNMTENAKIEYELSIAKMKDAQEEYTKLEILEAATPGSVTEEMWKIAEENLQSATLAVNEAAERWMEAISSQFKESLHLIINDFIEEAGGDNLNVLSQAWELEKKKDEAYLDDVNEAYAISELDRTMQKSIDETDNISAQNKLMQKRVEIEEELARIKEKQGKLSQYDIDRANALYDLTLKQIALEEAQQTANKMKLTRDAMGNYTYQYVQDEDAIAEAEAELAAAQNDLYNMDKDRKKELIDEWFSLMSEYEEKMSEALKTGNKELQAEIQEAYWGEKGFLSVLKTSLATLEEDSSWLNGLFSDTAEKIVNIKFSGEDGEDMTSQVNELLTNSQGLVSTFSQMIVTDTESVANAVTTLSNNITRNADDVANAANDIQANVATLLTNLSAYISKIAKLEEDLKPYNEEYNNLLTDQITVTEDSTQATKSLTQVVLRIADQLDNDKIDDFVQVGNKTYKVGTDGLYSIASEED